LYCQFFPNIHSIEYRRGDEVGKVDYLPLSFGSNGKDLDASFHMTVSPFHPSVYSVLADNCLSEFAIDGKSVDLSLFGQCKVDRMLDHPFLSSLLPPGEHTIVLHVTDTGGGREAFDLRPSIHDPLLIGMQLLIMGLVGACFFFLWRILGLKQWGLFTILVLGIVLRIAYFDVTQFGVRANDIGAHVDYIQWLLDHHSLPHNGDGWESFQPPLYYVLSASFAAVGEMVLPRHPMTWFLQFEGLLLSIGILFASAWLGSILFPPERRRRTEYFLFLALTATAPVLVASAGKINNDVLIQLFSFVAIGLLLRFWQTGYKGYWYGLSIVVILGILTKLNMVLFLPVAYLCLLLRHQLTYRQKTIVGLMTFFLVLSFTEWFYVLKYVAEAAPFPIGNISGLDKALTVQNTLPHYLWFHPLRFIRYPYIDVMKDFAGRQYFWEHFFKTAMYGEFDYGPRLALLCQILLSFIFVLVPLSVVGLFRSLRDRVERWETFPLFCLVVILLAAHIVFRWRSPFSCSQDFRYSVALFIPAFYYIATSLRCFPRVFRGVVATTLWAFVLCAVAFTVSIYVLKV